MARWRARFAARPVAAAWSLPLATGWLALTACSGALMAWNRNTPFLPVDVLDLLRAHAHAGVVGFFGTLIQGVTFQLVPMFTLAQAQRPRLALAGLMLSQVGLGALVVGLVGAGRGLTMAGAVVLVGAWGLTAIALRATLATRRRRRFETPVRVFLLGAGAGLVALPGGGAALILLPDGEAMLRTALAYGVVLIAGVLAFMILGMLAKILPFLVWMKAYGPRVGRERVPLTAELGWPRLLPLWAALQAIAVALLAVGGIADGPRLLAFSTVLLVVALGLYATHAVAVAVHLRHCRPVTAPAPNSSHERLRTLPH